MNHNISRRALVKSSIFGLMAVSMPSVIYAKNIFPIGTPDVNDDKVFFRYPSIDDEIVNEVVGKSHFDLDRVKKLVNKRPELAKATWDWGFGDWESAIGAASHVGRRDIALFLLSKGARPNIFTFAMLGAYEAVKSMIDFQPGIQKILGPHDISLLSHAEAGLRGKEQMSPENINSSEKLIDYLKSLGDADGKNYPNASEEEKQKYLGDYRYGEGETDGLSVKLNMRKLLSLGKLGQFGGALFKIGDNRFLYNGAPSVEISFQVENNVVKSLTVHEPVLTLVAKKVA